MTKFILIIFAVMFLNSCGKKGPLEYPGKRDKPEFGNISDELEQKFTPKIAEKDIVD